LKKQYTEKTPCVDFIRDDKLAKFTVEGLNGIYIPFGGGLKMCPGRHFAKQEIYLVVAMMLWAFDFEFVDLDGVRKTKADNRAFSVGTLHPERKNAARMWRRKISE
jgi:cytochrome P450